MAWKPLGWKAVAFSEIERFPRDVLRHHYANVPLHDDFTTIGKNNYGPVELLVGGTPCQSFSIAGLRGGLGDDRGNLALEFLRLAGRKMPRWIVWENVPGVLSSNGGKDFGAFLGGLAELGYGFAYRVLDAQYIRVQSYEFAVPQRRRRVFVVGYLGDWRRAAAVLFERESVCGNNPPSRETKQDIAGTVTSGIDRRRGAGQSPELLTARMVSFGEYQADGTASTIKERDHKDATDLVAFSSKDDGGDASAVSPTLRSMSHNGSRANGGGQVAIAIQENAWDENPNNGPDGKGFNDDGSSYTVLARNKPHAVAWLLHSENSNASKNGVGPKLASNARCLDTNGGYSISQGGNIVQSCFDERQVTSKTNRSKCEADVAGTSHSTPHSVAMSSCVRRLTPRECERLMGFPDDFTKIPYRNKPASDCPDGPRYKALGNSMAVNCMSWIGQRIELVESVMGGLER